MTHDAQTGSILSVGRKTRTISPALRRALDFRDRGCRFPGCGMRFTDGHHVKHWADGGETSLSNVLLLCSPHHRLVHEGGWQVTWWGEGRPAFFDPRGGTHFEGRWQPPQLPERALEAMIEENLRGVAESGPSASGRGAPDGATASAAESSGPAASAAKSGATTPGAEEPAPAAPDGSTAGALWKREADIPDEIYFRALEAID